ncbi:hypothetical protein [Rubritalea marina]|uniref:hypothetical protein n=1 Tax=Rubritalea marina TaxID=361055 RepID=UPI00036CDC88|nr:hypothetical protein [Rubritalea marina]
MYYNTFGVQCYGVSMGAGVFLGLFHRMVAEVLAISVYAVWGALGVLLVVYAMIWWRYFGFIAAAGDES